MKIVTYSGLIALVVVFAVNTGDDASRVARAGAQNRASTTLNCDSNGDSKRDISDAIYILTWLFGGGEGPVELRADGLPTVRLNGDCNGDDNRNLADAINLLNWLFSSRGSPPVCPRAVIDADGNIDELRGESSDCPRDNQELQFTPVETDSTEGWRIPDSQVGGLVTQHFEAIHSIGPLAEKNFNATLSALREQAPEVIELLAAGYKGIEKELYGLRWAQVQTLADIGSPLAMPVLVEIANEQVDPPVPQGSPDKVEKAIDLTSAYEEELVIRVTAIRGLGHLAAAPEIITDPSGAPEKDRTAALYLGRLVTTSTKDGIGAVREQALRSIADAMRRNARDKEYTAFLAKLLPRDFTFILDLSDILPVPPTGASPGLTPDGVGDGSQPPN